MNRVEKYERLQYLLQYRWDCGRRAPFSCDGSPHAGFPHRHARTDQVVRDAYLTAFITGRGWGKTRAAAEFVKARMLSQPNHRVSIIAPTFGVGKSVCMEGSSGLIGCLPPEKIANYNRSLGELVLKNGSQARLYGSHTTDDAEAPRGSQSNTLWMEELAQMRHAQGSWDNAHLANRLPDPKVIVTATPKNKPLIRKLLLDKSVDLRTGSTFVNKDNLAPEFIEYLTNKYQGTRLGAQELDGLLLQDSVGALWSRDLFIECEKPPANLSRVVIGVDPPGSHKDGALCGIVVTGLAPDGLLYVLADKSFRSTPEQWAAVTIQAYHEYQADCIVVETNYGGDMAIGTLRTYDDRPKVKKVTASRGKALRAEPVVSLYERKKVRHVGMLAELEDEMATWVPPGQTETDEFGIETPVPASDFSPDRVDALVWSVTELVLLPKRRRATMQFTQSSILTPSVGV